MLSKQQLAQFEEEGYLLLSGLIPQETVTKAEEAMWNMMGMEADNPDSRLTSVPCKIQQAPDV